MQHNAELDVVALEERLDELDLFGAEQEVHCGHVARHPGNRGPALHTVLCIRITLTEVFGSFCFLVKAPLFRCEGNTGIYDRYNNTVSAIPDATHRWCAGCPAGRGCQAERGAPGSRHSAPAPPPPPRSLPRSPPRQLTTLVQSEN